MEHNFNGHEVNGIHGGNGKKSYDRAFHLVNKLHDFTGMHYLSGKFCYDDFFRKNHARLIYTQPPLERSREICSTSFERYFPRNFNWF